MGIIIVIVGGVIALAGLICTIMILIEAFNDELWKGLLSLLVPLYLLYYAFAEYDHDYKWPIVLGSLFGSGLGGVIMSAGLSMMK
jgi:hypothetical protein